MDDVENRVLDIVAARLKIDRAKLSRETKLESLEIDSLDFVEIVFEVEDAFDISLPYNANKGAAGVKFETIGDVIDEVAKTVAQRDGTAN